jgi:hypothetical protein
MKYRVESLTNFLRDTLSGWSGIECIAVDPRADVLSYDPYFALVIDVYHRNGVPRASERRKLFGDPGDFETAVGREKDRFFLKEVPIRIEYKNVLDIDRMLDSLLDQLAYLRNSGTYPLYRLKNARILLGAGGWIDQVRYRLDHLPDQLWEALRDSFQAKMEHSLSDIGDSVLSGDSFFNLVSCAGFVRYTAASLFMANRRFEPSHREIDASLRTLPRIPDDFLGPWETFIREDQGMKPAQKRELAELMARSVLSLS